jgi:6-phosphofructokinase
VIGTARCDEFKEWEGMKKAVRTLIHHRISKLVVVGGDGSLTVRQASPAPPSRFFFFLKLSVFLL